MGCGKEHSMAVSPASAEKVRGRSPDTHSHMLDFPPDSRLKPARQPIFNLPTIVSAIIALMVGIHVLREYVLADQGNLQMLLQFAFIPIRELSPDLVRHAIPVGGARLWTFVTYGLLHADWTHLIFNCVWLAAFGSPLAWRFGTARFLAFSAAGTVAGAAMHLLVHPDGLAPLVGASAAISAHMAGASRFVFSRSGPIFRATGPQGYRQPAGSLRAVIADRRVLSFLGVWFGLNLLFGLTALGSNLASGAIAWEAHIGGFLVGLLLFPLFDPIAKRAT
jgi:membrane associated rhomboid family serine protease